MSREFFKHDGKAFGSEVFSIRAEPAEAAISMADKEGLAYFASHWRIVKGWALAERGYAEEGVAQIREGLTMASARGRK